MLLLKMYVLSSPSLVMVLSFNCMGIHGFKFIIVSYFLQVMWHGDFNPLPLNIELVRTCGAVTWKSSVTNDTQTMVSWKVIFALSSKLFVWDQ